jgi:hypothetical protein
MPLVAKGTTWQGLSLPFYRSLFFLRHLIDEPVAAYIIGTNSANAHLELFQALYEDPTLGLP